MLVILRFASNGGFYVANQTLCNLCQYNKIWSSTLLSTYYSTLNQSVMSLVEHSHDFHVLVYSYMSIDGFGTCLLNKNASSKHQNSLFSPSTWQCCHSVRQQIAIVWVPGVTSMVRIHTDMMGAADPEKKMQKNLDMKIVWEMAKIRGNPSLPACLILHPRYHTPSEFLWKFLWVLSTRPVL